MTGVETDRDRILLPADLEENIAGGFDRLVRQGEILWESYSSETVQKDGVNLVFQLSRYLGRKPIQDRNDEERKTGQGRNPFLHPDPNFVVANIGPSHILMYNKFPVYKSSLLLSTKTFVSQEEELDQSDINAGWSLLNHLHQKHLLIYNCGFDSGSSQGHKHMQLWGFPEKSEIGFDLFPSHAESEHEIATDLPGTALRHYVLSLPAQSTSAQVYAVYQRLLVEVQDCHRRCGSTSHNVALTKDWLCLIPRRSNGLDRGGGGNAAAALGTVWISEPKEQKVWTTPTIASHLSHIGVPLERYASMDNQ